MFRLRIPGRVTKMARLGLGRLVGGRRYVRFIVMSRSRTGSNMLLSMLNSHPAIVAHGEVFGQLRGRSVDRVLRAVYCRHLASIKAVGCKIFYYHPQDDSSGELWHRLQGTAGLKVIHLTRRNRLRSLVSYRIAGQQGVWRVIGKGERQPPRSRPVRMTVDELREGFRKTAQWEREYPRLFGAEAVLEVAYEDLMAAPEREFARVTDFLGVGRRAPHVATRRQNPEPLSLLVENYQELKQALAGTEWSGYFED